jgi:hypothetical protein
MIKLINIGMSIILILATSYVVGTIIHPDKQPQTQPFVHRIKSPYNCTVLHRYQTRAGQWITVGRKGRC